MDDLLKFGVGGFGLGIGLVTGVGVVALIRRFVRGALGEDDDRRRRAP